MNEWMWTVSEDTLNSIKLIDWYVYLISTVDQLKLVNTERQYIEQIVIFDINIVISWCDEKVFCFVFCQIFSFNVIAAVKKWLGWITLLVNSMQNYSILGLASKLKFSIANIFYN